MEMKWYCIACCVLFMCFFLSVYSADQSKKEIQIETYKAYSVCVEHKYGNCESIITK